MKDLLPDSWKLAPVLNLCDFHRGVTFKKADSSNEKKCGSLPVLRANAIQNGKILLNDLVYVDSSLISEKQLIREGDVLIAMSSGSKALVGKSAQADRDIEAGFGAFCGLLRPNTLLDKSFFGYYFSSPAYRSTVSGLAAGVNINNLKPAHFESINLPVAPIPEQKEITARLNNLIEQIESIRGRLDSVTNALQSFRQSVLASAVSGKLTEQWRRMNASNAKEQLELIKEKNPSKPPKSDLATFYELPHSWEWAIVKQVGTVQLGRQRAPKYHSGTNMRPYLRVANVMEGYIDTSDIMEMNFDERDYEKYRLEEGDVLLNEGQSHELVGRPAIYKGELPGACFTNTLVRFRSFEPVSNRYSYLVFLSYLKTGRFQEIASRTVNISHLGAGRFADMEFPFPPVEEQNEIVNQVEKLYKFSDQIERQVENARIRVNGLIPSVLEKAFRGELTSNWRAENPELGNSDTSVNALLDSITAEMEKLSPKKKQGRRNK